MPSYLVMPSYQDSRQGAIQLIRNYLQCLIHSCRRANTTLHRATPLQMLKGLHDVYKVVETFHITDTELNQIILEELQ